MCYAQTAYPVAPEVGYARDGQELPAAAGG